MEKLLRTLFEYQKFEQNPEFQKVIDDTVKHYEGMEICDDDLERVNAAGIINAGRGRKDGRF